MANLPLQPVLFLSLSVLLFLSIPVPPLPVQAQPSTSCASNLGPCANYINSTKPPDSCCTPLKDTITNDLQCLCAIFEDPTVLKTFGINLTAAEKLASNCGIDSSTTSQCKAAAPSATPVPSPPSNDVGSRPVWISVSGLIGVFSIFWAICA